MASNRVRIVCISDTHNDDLTGKVPDGDILLHAGDMTDNGTYIIEGPRLDKEAST
jgi:hypothetical protein